MFRFPLERLITVNREEERIRLRYLNEVLSQKNTVQSEIDAINVSVANSRVSLHKKITANRFDNSLIGMQSVYESNMNEVIAQKMQVLEKLLTYEAICRKQYEEIYIKRKALENLKEKQFQEYKENQKKRENSFYDDVVNAQSFRKKKHEAFTS